MNFQYYGHNNHLQLGVLRDYPGAKTHPTMSYGLDVTDIFPGISIDTIDTVQ